MGSGRVQLANVEASYRVFEIHHKAVTRCRSTACRRSSRREQASRHSVLMVWRIRRSDGSSRALAGPLIGFPATARQVRCSLPGNSLIAVWNSLLFSTRCSPEPRKSRIFREFCADLHLNGAQRCEIFAVTRTRSALPLVRDHLAVVRQRAGPHQFNFASELRHCAQGACNLLAQRVVCDRRLRFQRHCIGLALARDDEA